MPILPGATLGVLGGGQLGRLFALAARDMGYRVHVLDPDPACPASSLADRTLAARFDDVDAARDLAAGCAAVTVEIERISVASLEACAALTATRPGPAVLALSQDRRREKQWLNDHGFRTTSWRAVESRAALDDAVRTLGPGVLKTAREGYDGKGQVRVGDPKDVDEAWHGLGGAACIYEAWVPLERELSVIVARSPSGEVKTYPPAHNHHEHHILDWSALPGAFPGDLAGRAEALGRDVAAALDLEGLLAIELFALRDGTLLVNELAPRPHNSGHPTIEACVTNQFEQLVRAMCDLPLGSTDVLRPAAIANLLGDAWTDGPPDFARALTIPGVRLHLYGKSDARPGRKMGHLSATGATPEEAVERVRQARKLLLRRVPGQEG